MGRLAKIAERALPFEPWTVDSSVTCARSDSRTDYPIRVSVEFDVVPISTTIFNNLEANLVFRPQM